MPIVFAAGAVLISLVVTAFAARAVWCARADVAQARRELADWQQRALHATADVDAAIAQLDDLQQLRTVDVQRMRADVRELRDNYERVLRRYEQQQGIAALPASKRLH